MGESERTLKKALKEEMVYDLLRKKKNEKEKEKEKAKTEKREKEKRKKMHRNKGKKGLEKEEMAKKKITSSFAYSC